MAFLLYIDFSLKMITIRHIHDVYIHHHPEQESETNKLLKQLLNLNTDMAKNFADLEAQITTLNEKADGLQASLDAEQEQIAAAVGTLTAANQAQTELIQQLRDELAGLGADQAKIDELTGKAEAVNAKLDSAKTDLEGTIQDAPQP